MNEIKHGITKSGKKTEELLVELVDGLRKNEGASKKGDVIFDRASLDLKFFAEVKKNAWNQVRPMKYITVIGHVPETEEWFVVPADVVMKWAANRKGQHTPNPFVCVGLGKPSSVTKTGANTKWTPYLVQERDLKSKIISAHRSAMSNHSMRNFASRVRDDVESLAQKHKLQTEEINNG